MAWNDLRLFVLAASRQPPGMGRGGLTDWAN
jgi:hypothetical protein